MFRLRLGGWTQNQLDVGDILEQHGLKSVFAFAFDPASCTRHVAIRFHPSNGRSLLTYAPGSTIFVDGKPKDSLLKPITKVMIGVSAMMTVAAVLLKEVKMGAGLHSHCVHEAPEENQGCHEEVWLGLMRFGFKGGFWRLQVSTKTKCVIYRS